MCCWSASQDNLDLTSAEGTGIKTRHTQSIQHTHTRHARHAFGLDTRWGSMQQAPMRGVPGSFPPRKSYISAPGLPEGPRTCEGRPSGTARPVVKSWDLVIPQPLTCAYPVHCHLCRLGKAGKSWCDKSQSQGVPTAQRAWNVLTDKLQCGGLAQ